MGIGRLRWGGGPLDRRQPEMARSSWARGLGCLRSGTLVGGIFDFPDRVGGGLASGRHRPKGSGTREAFVFGGSLKGGIGDDNSWNRTISTLRGLISAQGASFGDGGTEREAVFMYVEPWPAP